MRKLIHELKDTEFDIARPLFSDFEKYQLMLLSLFEGNKPGRMFVNDKNNPSSGFCYLGSVFFIFAGSSNNAKFNNDLKNVLVNDIFPNYTGRLSYNIIFSELGCEKALKEIFGEFGTGEGVYYELNRNKRKEWECTLSPDFTIERVNKEFLESKAYTIPEDMRIESWLSGMYGSLKKYNKRGFAFSIVHKKKLVVSFCHCSYLSEDKSRSELGIYTRDDFRRKGLGKNLVFHTLNHCWEVGVKTAGWHTTHDNTASIKLAESVGYKFNRTYPINYGNWCKKHKVHYYWFSIFQEYFKVDR